MAANKPPSDDQLNRAAELRAAGASWETVAAKVKRVPSTVRRWANKYRDRWCQALLRAERHLVAWVEGESIQTLRVLLRSDDEKTRGQAARSLIGLRVELGKLDAKANPAEPRPDPEPDPLLTYLTRCSDVQLLDLLESVRRAVVRKSLPVGPGSGAGPG